MNILLRVFSYSSPRTRRQPAESVLASSPLASRSTTRVQKPRPKNAHHETLRKQQLASAALREINNGSASTPSRGRFKAQGGNWDDEVDDAETTVGAESLDAREQSGETVRPEKHRDNQHNHEDFSSGYGRRNRAPYNESNVILVKAENVDEKMVDVPEHVEQEEKPDKEHEEGDAEDEQQWTLTGLGGHRWKDDIIEMKVDWHGYDEHTWEPERNIQLDAPDVLFEYWETQGGRPENPNNPRLYDIFAVRAHHKNSLLVQWTGYDSCASTWIKRSTVQKTAPEALEEYLAELEHRKNEKKREATKEKMKKR